MALTTGVPDTVRLVDVSVSHIVPLPLGSVMLPVPKLMVRLFELPELNAPHERANDARDKVPEVSVNVPPSVRLAPRVSPRVLLVKVTVLATAPVPVVQVPVPELASKITASEAVGAVANGAPPEVADQLSIEVASHVPEPPTQYLVATDQHS